MQCHLDVIRTRNLVCVYCSSDSHTPQHFTYLDYLNTDNGGSTELYYFQTVKDKNATLLSKCNNYSYTNTKNYNTSRKIIIVKSMEYTP